MEWPTRSHIHDTNHRVWALITNMKAERQHWGLAHWLEAFVEFQAINPNHTSDQYSVMLEQTKSKIYHHILTLDPHAFQFGT